MSTKSQLVTNHLEKISGEIFKDYREEIRGLIRGKAGVYALYRRDELYYIGLASNLMRRLDRHLKDRHKGSWDKFSIFLTRRDEHIKELESLLLRISAPQGNKVTGKFASSINMSRELNRDMKQKDSHKQAKIMGKNTDKAATKRKTKTRNSKKKTLEGLVSSRMTLKGEYKDYEYRASLRKNGTIQYDGCVYHNPTAAAKAATSLKRGITGWLFWRYKDKSGEWVKLQNIKQGKIRSKNIGKSGALKGLVSSRMTLKGEYKDYEYRASLRKNGTIQYDGCVYYNPTAAAKAATSLKRGITGWSFWRYKDKSGEWVKLRNIKK
ncbi:MAG: hypothetical protein ACR2P9_06545 [Gammaproteobacteria bacterium]